MSCGKTHYVTRPEAKAASRKLPGKLRIYACPLCGFFHLTHQNPSRFRQRKRALRRGDA